LVYFHGEPAGRPFIRSPPENNWKRKKIYLVSTYVSGLDNRSRVRVQMKLIGELLKALNERQYRPNNKPRNVEGHAWWYTPTAGRNVVEPFDLVLAKPLSVFRGGLSTRLNVKSW
jgi:hypothetical protein